MNTNIDYKLIGQRLQKIRKERGFTQEQLAEAMTYSPGYISQIERGLSRPNLDTIAGICNFLNCDISEVLSQSNSVCNYMIPDLNELYTQLNPDERRMLYHLLKTYIDEKK
jgi:transcriptional regulator with XRE-family HTH domain